MKFRSSEADDRTTAKQRDPSAVGHNRSVSLASSGLSSCNPERTVHFAPCEVVLTLSWRLAV